MPSLGRLFVFEGADGAGKSTLSKNFANYLQATGIDCEHLAFPGNEVGTLGHHVYKLHHDPARFGVDSLTPTSLQILHIAAHIDAIERHILPTLKQGRSIVLDRFWWSTWAYGKASGVNIQSLELMINIELLHWNQVKPEMIFLIVRNTGMDEDVSDAVILRRNSAYQELAEKGHHRYPICVIENNSSLKDALDQIIRSAKARLP